MTDFQRVIASHHGVSLRTVRRWCETGRLPGVFRTKGGHYRLAGPYLKQLRRAEEFQETFPVDLRRVPLKTQARWLKELVKVTQVSITLGQPLNAQEHPNVPIKQLLHPRAIEVAENKAGILLVYAERLRGEQIKVTPKTLALSLQISVATLYNQYKAKNVKRACAYGSDLAVFEPNETERAQLKDFVLSVIAPKRA
jgi:hypothetical protein